MKILEKNLFSSIALKQEILRTPSVLQAAEILTHRIVHAYQSGNKVLFCGNGGSAADAQHLAAELSGRYYHDRPPLFAEALHVNTSYLTAVANDYCYEEVFARLVRAMGRRGDVLIALSTSGNSANVVAAMKAARDAGMITAGFTGEGGGRMKEWSDVLIEIPSRDTPRIQECHMIIGHSICEEVEQILFPRT